jgi:hypothetical protein
MADWFLLARSKESGRPGRVFWAGCELLDKLVSVLFLELTGVASSGCGTAGFSGQDFRFSRLAK